MRIRPVIVLLLAVIVSGCAMEKSPFVRVENGRFMRSDEPLAFVGANFWYGPILASEGRGGDMNRLCRELDTLKAIGVTNLRILVGGEGPEGVPTRISPMLQKESGVYNDTLLCGMDRLLVEMARRDMQAVLFMNNAWEWSGGFGLYLEWAGAGEALIPSIDGYVPFMEQMSGFSTNAAAQELFFEHLRFIVGRTNTVTGKPYKDDPTIFSWQICNEPRCFSSNSEVQNAFVEWLWKAAGVIKSVDPNHMVSTGSEGAWGCEQDMELCERIHSCPDVDYVTMHIWPFNWSWVNKDRPQDDIRSAIDNTDAYIDAHIGMSAKLGKPLVLEEFGFPRDNHEFVQGTPVTGRDAYYSHVMDKMRESVLGGGVFMGMNFWGWGGFASQNPDRVFWKMGDDYCGDPGQEEQGLNSVYVSDSSTLELIKKSTQHINPNY